MADFNTAPKDTITIDTAGEIDAAWRNAGMPDNGLRIYGLRRTGNRTMTFLGVPSLNGSAPCYTLSNGRYLHLSGPTLAEWYAEQDAADLRDTQRMAV
jgi:hypothetical protein